GVGLRAGEADEVRREVRADDPPGGPHALGGRDRGRAAAAADVQDPLAGREIDPIDGRAAEAIPGREGRVVEGVGRPGVRLRRAALRVGGHPISGKASASKCADRASNRERRARAAAGTTAASKSSPANSRTASIESNQVTVTNSTSPGPAFLRRTCAPRYPGTRWMPGRISDRRSAA